MHQYGHRVHAPLLRLSLLFQVPPGGKSVPRVSVLTACSQSIAACALFLAAKVEEQPRKLEHVIKIAHLIQHQKLSQLDVAAEVSATGVSDAGPDSHSHIRRRN